MIVELINRSGAVLDHYQFSKSRIRVGRAYDNDLILHDDHVDGHHMVLNIDVSGEGFSYQDLGSTNGTKVVDASQQQGRSTSFLDSGSTLCLGKTYLRVKLREHEVPPAIPISLLDNIFSFFGNVWLVLLSAIIFIGLATYSAYITQPHGSAISKNLLQNAYMLLGVFAYAALWSMVARVQKLDGRFLVHANLLMWVFIVDSLVRLYQAFFEFNFAIPSRLDVISLIVGAMLGYVLIYFSMYISTRASYIKRVSIAAILPLLVMAISLSTYYKKPDFSALPNYESLVVPPAWNLRSGITQETFLEESESLYDESP